MTAESLLLRPETFEQSEAILRGHFEGVKLLRDGFDRLRIVCSGITADGGKHSISVTVDLPTNDRLKYEALHISAVQTCYDTWIALQ